MVGDQLMTDIGLPIVRAFVRFWSALWLSSSIKTQINRARERRVMKQMAEKYGRVYEKKFKNGRIILYWLWSPHSDRKQKGLGYTPQSSS